MPGTEELAELGSGAQGRVVLARHEATGNVVAIKYLNEGLLGDPRALDRMRGEAAALSRISSPHVVRLYGLAESAHGAAMVMEAIPGQSLRTVLDAQSGPLPAEAALTILKGSLLGLAAAHAAGVIHRDYKPGNILVLRDGLSKLVDFGVAGLTGQTGWLGTAGYMAPEQWSGEPISPATDLYAATCVFVECLTGSRPYDGRTVESLRIQHMTSPVPLQMIPEPLRPIVAQGLAKSPAQRLWDAERFAQQLESIAALHFGSDWERHGREKLGIAAAGIAIAAPLAALVGGAFVAPGATVTGAAVGQAAGTQTVVHAGTAGGKGALAKIGGAKGVAAMGTAGAAITASVMFLPSDPGVGGEAQGSLRVHFTRPGVLTGQPYMPAADSPYMRLSIQVSPARVKPGTRMRVTTFFSARTPQGGKYLPGGDLQCFGEDSDRRDVIGSYNFSIGEQSKNSNPRQAVLGLYKTPPAQKDKIPGTGAIRLTTSRRVSAEKQPYVQAECGYLSTWTDVREIVVPSHDTVRPGSYLVSPTIPPQLTVITRRGTAISPASVGAVVEGSLPVMTVLE
ncbi:serine/threonine-protein kinase [Thermomonospora umbrina]|uniref:non-specific serine/threonine protein kinase n=1 Tax=Thermomonospora umbrina TaxID=111806 RepID=A0A3D9SWJ4_9ACTN|nr:serine/threonine-protein kinase [Thermomonospora umbrina]REE96011.1 serine/threonine protein kinase [Thermomonospora umbrina]